MAAEVISAIPTAYAGIKFRSRLEARWAVFFDCLGLRWEYEPEGVRCASGHYLPDFYLHLSEPVIIEVKRGNYPQPDQVEEARWRAAAELFNCRFAVVRGMRRPGDELDEDDINLIAPHWDNFYEFQACGRCGEIGLEYQGQPERIGCSSRRPRPIMSVDEAYSRALSARFEFGEAPDTGAP